MQRDSMRMKSGEMSGRRWGGRGGGEKEKGERGKKKVGGRLRVYYAGGRYN